MTTKLIKLPLSLGESELYLVKKGKDWLDILLMNNNSGLTQILARITKSKRGRVDVLEINLVENWLSKRNFLTENDLEIVDAPPEQSQLLFPPRID